MKNKADFLKASLKFLFVLPGNPAKKEDLSKYGGKYKYILFILKRCRSLEILVHVCVSIKIFVHNDGSTPITKVSIFSYFESYFFLLLPLAESFSFISSSVSSIPEVLKSITRKCINFFKSYFCSQK